MVAMGRGRAAEARQRFARAIELGSRDAGTWFEYAMLLRDAREPDAEVLRLLHKATELNPKYAEAFFVAGTMEAKAGRHAEAVASLQKAADILPRRSNFWHAMAVSYMQLNQPEPAYRAAERASITAVNDAEIKAAAAILLAAAAPPPPLPASREPVIRIPESWKNLPGDARVEGRLVKVECLGPTAKLEIESEGKRIELKVLRPGKIPIQNSTSERREFTCGAQNPAPAAAIDYIRATGEVTAIQFK
jgi:tetratricopeptide (TPR) repeat protein